MLYYVKRLVYLDVFCIIIYILSIGVSVSVFVVKSKAFHVLNMTLFCINNLSQIATFVRVKATCFTLRKGKKGSGYSETNSQNPSTVIKTK